MSVKEALDFSFDHATGLAHDVEDWEVPSEHSGAVSELDRAEGIVQGENVLMDFVVHCTLGRRASDRVRVEVHKRIPHECGVRVRASQAAEVAHDHGEDNWTPRRALRHLLQRHQALCHAFLSFHH